MHFSRFLFAVTFFVIPLFSFTQSRWDVGVKLNDAELTMPWNGGFNAPQFSNIDLNRDGVTDMISFDRQGNMLRTYIHLPATGRWVLDWDYAKIFPPIVDWILIVDYNRDGVEDIFTSSSNTGVAGITVYQGAYQNDQWTFTKMPDRGKDYLQVPAGGDLTNLYVSWDDIPAIQDIDGDGDYDVLAYEPGGLYITYFANRSVENGWGLDSFRFDIKDICWGKVLENELSELIYLSETPDMCSHGQLTNDGIITPRHTGSTILAFDQDYDGDQDALIGDISSRKLVFLHNGLTSQEAWMTAQDAHFPSQDSSVRIPYFVGPYLVQLDDDPEPELLAAVNSRSLSEDVQCVWRYDDDPFTDGPLDFHLTEKGFLENDMIDVGSYSRPAFADINGDGLMDLVVGGYHFEESTLTRSPFLWLLLNEGTATQPYFHLISTDYLGMSQFGSIPTFDFAPAFGDIDGNGTIDLLVGDQNGKLFFYKNDALPGQPVNYEPYVYPYMNINVGVSATPQIADINGDGLGDLIVGERTGNADNNGRCSNLNYFENVGSVGNALFGADPAIAPNTQCFGRVLFDIQIGLPQYSAPVILPSGDHLILLTGSDPGRMELFTDLQNGKSGSITLLDEAYGNLDVGNRSAPALADLDHDGYYDLVVGNQRGGLELVHTDLQVGTTAVESPVAVSGRPYSILVIDPAGEYELTWKNGTAGSLEIYDVQGRLIFQSKAAESFEQIDLSGQAAGMYFLQLRQGRNSWVEKLVFGGH